MQPRIYVYLITFVDQPFWYWGWHKEKKFNEYYMGSPRTNKKYWNLYEPIKEIVEFFDYSEEGEFLAQAFEQSLIKPDLNNPFCLNEHCGGVYSSRALKEKWKDPEYKNRVSKAIAETLKEKWKDPEYRESFTRYKGTEAALTPSSRQKRVASYKRIEHQQGERNSQFGTMWVTDGTKEGSRRIKKGDPIPEGYRPGRVCK